MKKSLKEKLLKLITALILPLLQIYLISYFKIQHNERMYMYKELEARITTTKKTIEEQENNLLKLIKHHNPLLPKDKNDLQHICYMYEQCTKKRENLKQEREELDKTDQKVLNSRNKYFLVTIIVPFMVIFCNFWINKFNNTLAKKKILVIVMALIIIGSIILIEFTEIKRLLSHHPQENIDIGDSNVELKEQIDTIQTKLKQ
ncbi:hypothetical protein [Candidatus Phytoplasma meliae]|uniref:Uncharacterized protein n=1 Tax=Candidatus Phytoplasma meliae TaxID=1848402 RepID=A0ABS5CXP2_9MOLU|nr:hypothetical protein [Candidatus Phytoplasma meliae]MBP5835746.1 hypothetical protein [Candidatus Phytoplasma meliae]